jgi:hypothetical protein
MTENSFEAMTDVEIDAAAARETKFIWKSFRHEDRKAARNARRRRLRRWRGPNREWHSNRDS